MTIIEIHNLPVMWESIQPAKVHESCFRSYQALAKIRELLTKGVPPSVAVQLLDEMTHGDFRTGE